MDNEVLVRDPDLAPDLALQAYAAPYHAAIDALRKPTEEALQGEPDNNADYLPSIAEIKSLVAKLAWRVRSDYDSTSVRMGNLARLLLPLDLTVSDSPYLPNIMLVS